MERLNAVRDNGGDGSLSHRLKVKEQLANSACSSVFGATIDGNNEVVVKASQGLGARLSKSLFFPCSFSFIYVF
jgi:hypothetical protein